MCIETCVWHSFSLYCVVCLLSIDFNSTFRRFLYSSIVSLRDDMNFCCCYCRHVIACGRRSNKTMMMNDLNCFGRSRCQAESALTLNVCVCVWLLYALFFAVTLIKLNTQNDFASPWLLSPTMLSVQFITIIIYELLTNPPHTRTHWALLSKFFSSSF